MEAGISIDSPTLIGVTESNANPAIWPSIMLWIYLVGMIVTTLITIANLFRLIRIISSGKKIPFQGYTLIIISQTHITPFSWLRFIVLPQGETETACKMIIAHEKAHIGHGHWLDLLMAQIVCILLWFNPASWLMLRELRAVHEYQADAQVLANGTDARSYQLLLIKKAVGQRFPSLANSLNHSKLKNRITMMCTKSSPKGRPLRAIAIVPAFALALACVNIPAVASVLSQSSEARLVSTAKVTNFSATDTELLPSNPESTALVKDESSEPKASKTIRPEFPGGEFAMFKYLMENISYPKEAIAAKKEGRVVVEFLIGKDGSISNAVVKHSIDPALDKEALRVVNAMPKWTPGMEDGKVVEATYSLPVSFKLN